MSTHSNRTFIPICPFVKKLLEIIDDPINFDLESKRKFVRWSDDGESIVIEVQNFKKWILPQYFHHSSITSFVRQLNAHGFKKISKIKTVEFKEPKFKEPKPSRSKYHDKYIHFRPEVFVKTKKPNDKSSNSVSKTEVSSDKSGQPEVMVYCHQHFVKKFPENFDKIQRENSKNQFKLLMDSNPVAKTQISSAVVQANNLSKNTSITSTRSKYHNKYIHFRVTDELNNLKSGNQLLNTLPPMGPFWTHLFKSATLSKNVSFLAGNRTFISSTFWVQNGPIAGRLLKQASL